MVLTEAVLMLNIVYAAIPLGTYWAYSDVKGGGVFKLFPGSSGTSLPAWWVTMQVLSIIAVVCAFFGAVLSVIGRAKASFSVWQASAGCNSLVAICATISFALFAVQGPKDADLKDLASGSFDYWIGFAFEILTAVMGAFGVCLALWAGAAQQLDADSDGEYGSGAGNPASGADGSYGYDKLADA